MDAGATTRDRVLRAAAELLAQGGREAVSTRAVSAAAGVQAPTLYRLFGDKEGLLDAVVAHGFAEYLVRKHALGESEDPVEDLRRGWDLHVEFGLAHPAHYLLMFGEPRPGDPPPAAQESAEKLRLMVTRVAAAGRLRIGVERAANLVHATCVGVVLSLIGTPEAERDPELSALARETVLRAVTTVGRPVVEVDVATRAVALRASLQKHPVRTLSPAEHTLLSEWLDRVADARA